MYYKPTKLDIALDISNIYTIHYFEYHKSFVFAGESHNFWELMYVDRGEIQVSNNEKTFTLKEKQLIIFPPDKFHALKADNKIAPNTIIVSFECNSQELKETEEKIFYINDYMRSLLAGILREGRNAFSNDLSDPQYRKLQKRNKTSASQQMIKCYLELLLLELLREGNQTKNTGKSTVLKNEYDKIFKSVALWIDNHIDKKFTIAELCAESMTNKKTLENIFREKSNMSVIEYCRKRKTEFAKRLLREENSNISEISEKLGFSSIHYFSRTFKKIENMTPSQYANSTKAIIDHSDNVKEIL